MSQLSEIVTGLDFIETSSLKKSLKYNLLLCDV